MNAGINQAIGNVSSSKDDIYLIQDCQVVLKKKIPQKCGRKASWVDEEIYEMIGVIGENKNCIKPLNFFEYTKQTKFDYTRKVKESAHQETEKNLLVQSCR